MNRTSDDPFAADEFRIFSHEQMAVFLACSAHELRNTLVAISIDTQSLEHRLQATWGKTDGLRQILQHLRLRSQNAEAITKTLLDLYSSLPEAPSEANLLTLCLEAVRICSVRARDQHVQILVGSLGSEPIFHCRARWLVLAFLAVIQNAVESYTDVDRCENSRDVMISPSYSGELLTLTIADKGIGIPEDILPKVFDNGFTTKARAAGLGLYVAKTVIRQHQGDITLHSSPGEGTTVRIVLPISMEKHPWRGPFKSRYSAPDAAAEIETPDLKSASREPSHGGILIVDDDYTIAMSLASYLRAAGYAVSTAYSACDAMNHVAESDVPFDVAIIDVCLPTSHNTDTLEIEGINLARRIRELSPRTRLIGMSAFIPSEKVRALTAEFDAYLDKPLQAIELTKVVTHLTDPEKKELEPVIFIVHGHDEVAKLSLKNYLQNTLQLGEPIILHEQPSQGRTIIEKFEQTTQKVDVVFVLLTPDDIGGTATDPDTKKRRARQNVIFELGFFLGKLQRTAAKIVLLHKGCVELPSDMSGLIYIDIQGGIEAAGEEIRRELKKWL